MRLEEPHLKKKSLSTGKGWIAASRCACKNCEIAVRVAFAVLAGRAPPIVTAKI